MKKHRHDENIMGLNTEHHSDVTLPNSLALVQNVTTSSRSLALLFIWSIWGWFVRSNTHPHPRMLCEICGVSSEIERTSPSSQRYKLFHIPEQKKCTMTSMSMATRLVQYQFDIG
ncbi:uncharacterized protein [Physcomitrium patens]|uniref:uncharacterized protein isoform X2 n=1 Tax=Physcomitrium patens TaxID=3218 RepID=UPI003CCE190A